MGMAEEALTHALQHAQEQLNEAIGRGEHHTSVGEEALRLACFRIVHTVPLCSRALLQTAREHPAFEFALFYERVRTGVADQNYCMDGVPAGVALFQGFTSVTVSNHAVERLRLAEVLADRATFVRRIERLPAAGPSRSMLEESHHAALGPRVPAELASLVAHTRAVVQALRAVKPPTQFRNCANCNCQRLMFVGSDADSWGAAEASSVGDVEDDCGEPSDYWMEAAGGAAEAVPPDTRRFCSRACAREHAAHLEAAMPDCGLQLEADDASVKRGRARVADAFRLALKRNEVAARALRTWRSRERRQLAVSEAELARHRARRIAALNVDLGVLYAASLLAESKSLSLGKLLPGSKIYWRDDSLYYRRAMVAVRKAYSRARRDEGVVSSLLTIPKFLEHVGAQSTRLFESR